MENGIDICHVMLNICHIMLTWHIQITHPAFNLWQEYLYHLPSQSHVPWQCACNGSTLSHISSTHCEEWCHWSPALNEQSNMQHQFDNDEPSNPYSPLSSNSPHICHVWVPWMACCIQHQQAGQDQCSLKEWWPQPPRSLIAWLTNPIHHEVWLENLLNPHHPALAHCTGMVCLTLIPNDLTTRITFFAWQAEINGRMSETWQQ